MYHAGGSSCSRGLGYRETNTTAGMHGLDAFFLLIMISILQCEQSNVVVTSGCAREGQTKNSFLNRPRSDAIASVVASLGIFDGRAVSARNIPDDVRSRCMWIVCMRYSLLLTGFFPPVPRVRWLNEGLIRDRQDPYLSYSSYTYTGS
jgi:hypothetical protein